MSKKANRIGPGRAKPWCAARKFKKAWDAAKTRKRVQKLIENQRQRMAASEEKLNDGATT